MNQPETILYTPLSKEQFAQLFNRKNIQGAHSYALVRFLDRRRRGGLDFLLIRVCEPSYDYVIWEIKQTQGTVTTGWFFPEETEMWIAAGPLGKPKTTLEEILHSMAEGTFYDVFEFPNVDGPIHTKWAQRI